MTTFAHPCPGGRETDAFGWRAAIAGVVPAQLHAGQDYAAAEGTPVYAMHSGRISRAGWDPFPGLVGAGNAIEVGSAQYMSRYQHLSGIAVGVGQHVAAGDLIGWVGTTGNSTGPHLHAELHLPGGPVDPRPYLKASGILSSAQVQEIKEHVTAHAKAQADRVKADLQAHIDLALRRTLERVDLGTSKVLSETQRVPDKILDTEIVRHGVNGKFTTLRTFLAKGESLLRRGISRGDRTLVLLGDPEPADAEPSEPR